MFNSRSEYSVVGLHLGIKLEGKYNIENFNLKQYLDAYMVNEEYSNSYAFPAEWMETIDPSYCMKGADEDCGDFGAD